ncbi:MAG: hemerythrin domain-containing protein [Planctomycetes bacterium]|nr:hemerythrin domain-containing protein [Planctomycetota bacterium]
MTPTRKPAKAKDQILDDHRQIGALLSQVPSAGSTARTVDLLQTLVPLLRRHFQEEEAEISGLHAVIQRRTPHLVYALQDLKRDHTDLLQAAQELLDLANSPDADEAQLQRRGRALKDGIAAHETKETELFVDSIWTDLGEGD